MTGIYSHRVVAVIGATGMLGNAITQHLEGNGAIVYATTRKTKTDLAHLGQKVEAVHNFNMGNESDRKMLLDRCAAEYGHLDALIITPGSFQQLSAAETTAEVLHELFDSNVAGPWSMMTESRNLLKLAEHPRVILFGYSGAEQVEARRLVSGYAAVKTGLLIMAKSLAREWTPETRITVNLLAPGVLSAPPEDTVDPYPEISVDDVLSALDFLLSPAADAVSGTQINISRGWQV